MSAANQQELNKFVEVVDKFMANYARLTDNKTVDAVYASNNPKLIKDYEATVQKAHILKLTIEKTVGAWNTFKRVHGAVTDVTSMYIGDAVDWVRGLFGRDASGGLGAIQIPAAAWVAAVVSAAVILNMTMNKIFVALEASRIQKENPNISREDALNSARNAVSSGGIFGTGIDYKTLAVAGLAAYFLLGRK